MKKGLFVCMMMLASILVFTGCGKKQVQSTSEPEKKSDETTVVAKETVAEPKAEESITVWVQQFLGADKAEENKEMFLDFAEQFKKETGITANIQVIPWANRDQKMLMAFSANKGPDVVYLITDHLAQFSYMGILEPLESYISDDVKNDYLSSALDADTVDGHLYGVPMLMQMFAYAYNLDLLKEIGWDTSKLPETWDDLEKMFKMAKDHNCYGLLYEGGQNGNMSFYPWMWQAGGDVIDKKGNVVFNSEETRRATSKLTEWYQKGYMPKDSLTLVSDNQVYPIWESGKVCLFPCDAGRITNYLTGKQQVNFNIGIANPPKDKEQVLYGTVGSWCVATTSKNKEAAAAFIMKMTEPENMKLFLKKTGYLPPRKSLMNIYDGNEQLENMVKSLAYIRPGVVHPAGRTITNTLIPPFVQAAFMGKDIDQLLKDTTNSIQKAVDDSMALKTN